MQPFQTHIGRAAVLDWCDVNTDLIIPARYLKRTERSGYGPLLFADKRYEPGAAPPPDDPSNQGPLAADFPLNQPELRDATVLVVGRNFGCGSSREHAVWAVQQAGFRAVVAPGKGEGFADIFESNAFKSGLLPIELDPGDWDALVAELRAAPGRVQVEIDLNECVLAAHTPTGDIRFSFEIPEEERRRLLRGLDAVAETLLLDDAITAHERSRPAWLAASSTPA
ncbi:MAG: 3-isopropylmalate dehydratase small subunit [Planctomycetota bacterium]|nr:3-isopropylmalate dehydratase small subunit [Planctomycetota bacterium]